MSIIRDLQTDENGWFADGKFNSISLFKGEMNVSIFVHDGATVAYAEKCITHYNNLNNNSDLLFKLQEYLEKFFLYMYAEWNEMGIYDEIVKSIEPVMDGYKSGKNIIEYLSRPRLYVFPPKGDGELLPKN